METSINKPTGVIEGLETIIFYTLFYIFPDKLLTPYIIMSILTMLGALQRVVWSVKNIKN